MRTAARFFCGFALGWLIYMVAMVLTVFDGLLSLILQPFVGAFVSGFFVMLAFFFGLLLRAPRIREAWNGVGWWALLISAAAIGVMIFHAPLGFQAEY